MVDAPDSSNFTPVLPSSIPVSDNLDINAALGHAPDGSHLSHVTDPDGSHLLSSNTDGDSLPANMHVTDVVLPVKKKNGHPFSFNSPEELEVAVKTYFSNPANEPFTMSGLALACGVSRMTFLRYKGRNGFYKICEWAKANIEAQTEKKLFERGLSAAGPIFSLCNNFSDDWHQKNETDHNIGGQRDNPVKIEFTLVKPGDK
jgi:hypothetical protein